MENFMDVMTRKSVNLFCYYLFWEEIYLLIFYRKKRTCGMSKTYDAKSLWQ